MSHKTTGTRRAEIFTHGISVFIFSETFTIFSSFQSGHKGGNGGIFQCSLVVIIDWMAVW